jgi:enamine deaminase RidA (YjgF/YER057c/UK114 family)
MPSRATPVCLLNLGISRLSTVETHCDSLSQVPRRSVSPLPLEVLETDPMVQRKDRKTTSSGSPFEDSIGFSRAVRVGNRVVISGTAPIEPSGECSDDASDQARRCFEIIEEALSQVGAKLDDVVRTRIFLTSASDADAVGLVHGEIFHKTRPAATMVVVAALLDPRWRVEIEAEAVVAQ